MLHRVSDVRVSGKNLDIGQSLREQAQERISEAVAKYFDGGFSSRVTVEKEGTGFRTDCTVHLDTGALMRVSGTAHDAYASVSQVVERIGKQMRRDKRKRTAHSNGHVIDFHVIDFNEVSEPDAVRDQAIRSIEIAQNMGDARPIVAERVDGLDRMSLENAIERMEKGALSSYVFRNSGTGRINILQDRTDGSIGWIDVAEKALP